MRKLTFDYLSNLGENRECSSARIWITMKLADHRFCFYFRTETIYLESEINPERVLLKIPFTKEALSKIITAFIG